MFVDDWIVKHTKLYKRCLCCKRISEDVKLWDSMTRYTNEELNKPILLCTRCGEEHVENMKALWADYYGGLL